ncbi:Hypothetical predicted protein [Mytilus galloprovincialis]|uniref:Myb/SANT-like DNA-binding domain-containing protein n=1 Tax=Mytilus galloprovincialis TaxID=29158 RepID=A0A8B6GZT5_MYTGA|nr:Hypothetical predicted protein [Mytilus galloprovincialis]
MAETLSSKKPTQLQKKADNWQIIAHQISALGVSIRTPKDVKDKWSNCNKVAKRIYTDNKKEKGAAERS